MVNATLYPYDLTNVTTADNIFEFIQEVNTLTNEIFMTGILFAGFVIMFVAMKKADNKEALLVSGFITAVLAIFFRAMDFISTAKIIIIMIAFAIIFAVSMVKKE